MRYGNHRDPEDSPPPPPIAMVQCYPLVSSHPGYSGEDHVSYLGYFLIAYRLSRNGKGQVYSKASKATDVSNNQALPPEWNVPIVSIGGYKGIQFDDPPSMISSRCDIAWVNACWSATSVCGHDDWGLRLISSESLDATDATATGNVVFATLVDDPASVRDSVDAILGQIMVEAANATASITAGSVYTALVAEAVTAHDLCSVFGVFAAVSEPATASSAQDAALATVVTTALIAGERAVVFVTPTAASVTILETGTALTTR